MASHGLGSGKQQNKYCKKLKIFIIKYKHLQVFNKIYQGHP